ncbi:MAG: type III-B CRISPR module RAMP protein Cmr1 [Magnetococcales bacterium]|nr:type III-B CRISPR module RAMP protein Cmr1 [Magnetococcales bacterium]
MRRLQATFEIVTPMFLGGADPAKAEALFRLASLRGVLRWWWRALHYPNFYAAAQVATRRREAALQELHKAEVRLFGSSEDGQGAVLMRLEKVENLEMVKPKTKLMNGKRIVGPGACYLAGQGTFGKEAGVITRSCLQKDQSLIISLMVKEKAERWEVDSLVRALKILGLLGGIGSRSRRGWGSVRLVELTAAGFAAEDPAVSFVPPSSREEYEQSIAGLFADIPYAQAEPLPPFTAFGPGSRIDVLREGENSLALLDKVGKEMQRYRSWGHHKVVNGEPIEKNFKDDHDWSKGKPLSSDYVPRRTVFGLPHNYGKGASVKPAGKLDRRASPLLLHIHKLKDNLHIAVSVRLPAEFLPNDDQVETLKDKHPGPKPAKIDWRVLDTFIDGKGPHSEPSTKQKSYFPDKSAVLP